jgi:energy-coupling factor transporter ATP-binding protein EcfA2
VSYQPQVKAVKAIVDENGEVICPYQGLQAFTAKQREFFFGRKQTVETIKQNLEQKPFVPVIGASGSGKSSVVRAGLMPWLEESGWRILAPINPGFEPLVELRGALKPFFEGKRGQQLKVWVEDPAQFPQGLTNIITELPGEQKFLLVVDQFEEVFTVCTDEAERQRFIELITQVTEIANSRLAVVTTMRADFLEPCLRYAALHHLIQTQAVLMPPLTGVDLRDAIVDPAKRQGFKIEEPLLLKLIEDVGKESGSLPLLEFTLTKLWDKRDSTRQLLALAEYEKLGGLSGALNLHAEKVYRYQDYEQEIPIKERTALEQRLIQRIFLRLIRTGQGNNDTRQRQLKTKLLELVIDGTEDHQLLSQLLNEDIGLVQGRLLVAGKNDQQAEWIDLAHEALIEGWQRYTEWRKQDRELRRLTDQVDDALRNWEEQSQRDDFLMSRGLVKQVTKRWSELQLYLSKAAREFYQCSYDHDREKTSYESDINHFKGQLQELQMNLTERLEQIAKLRKLRESREVDNSQNRTPAESPNIEETASLDNTNQTALVRLRDEVDRFLGRAQRFEERMQSANSSADWIGSHQATIVDVIVQYSLANTLQTSSDNMSFNQPENVQKYNGEVNRYLDWLQESLRRGQPLIDQIDEIPISLPRNIYAEAFELIKQEWESSNLSNALIQEIQPYLKYLIAYFEYGE